MTWSRPQQVVHSDGLVDANSLFIYYGSRSALPARVRCFIDLAVERLTGGPDFVLAMRNWRGPGRMESLQA